MIGDPMNTQKMVSRRVAVAVGAVGLALLVGQFVWWNKECPEVLKRKKLYY